MLEIKLAWKGFIKDSAKFPEVGHKINLVLRPLIDTHQGHPFENAHRAKATSELNRTVPKCLKQPNIPTETSSEMSYKAFYHQPRSFLD